MEKSLIFVVFVGKVFVMEAHTDFTYEYIMTIKDMSVTNAGKRSFATITLQSTRKYIQVRRPISVKNVASALAVGTTSLFITRACTLGRRCGKNIKQPFINVMFVRKFLKANQVWKCIFGRIQVKNHTSVRFATNLSESRKL